MMVNLFKFFTALSRNAGRSTVRKFNERVYQMPQIFPNAETAQSCDRGDWKWEQKWTLGNYDRSANRP